RKANRNCTRRYCKQCCEVAGGCRVHRVASVSSPVAAQQHIIPPLSTIDPMSTQLDHPPVTTTQSLPAASRVYARPLDANYARNYVLSHQRTLVAEQRFQADQSLSIMIRNMIDVVLWLKNNDPPHLVRLTCTTPGKFVPGDHPLLMRFDLGDYIAVYCSDQHAWIEQDIKTPLLSPPNSTILLRSINLTDNNMLLGFTERVLSLSRTAAASPTPLPLTKSPSPTMMSPLLLTTGDSDTSPVLVPAPAIIQPNVFATVPPGAQARFPWKYACDMVPRIQLFVDLSDDQMIQTLFATTFPNCTYTKATFYKHRAAYRAAIKNSGDKVECAINAGYSPAGQWNTLLAEIKANAASLT
ncbi:hypothetical protein F4604DRAFT_1495078, partial [Suillus subluteus]